MKSKRRCKCRNCHFLFIPDPRNAKRQKFCDKPECRKASKIESQRNWLNKPKNKDYFRGSENVLRVQLWRAQHPGYWRRKGPPGRFALQDPLTEQPSENMNNNADFVNTALQDLLIAQPYVLLGIISHFTGTALQDDIDATVRRLQQLGRDIAAHRINHNKGGQHGVETTYPAPPGAACAAPVQLGGPSAGP